jgi:hypothetical protein
MANTIFSGARFTLPYYATTGTDLTAIIPLTWTPSATTLQLNGGSIQAIRSSNTSMMFLNQHHATADTTSITLTRSRGTYFSQSPVQVNDVIGKLQFRANTAAGNTVNAANITAQVDTGSVSAGSLNSKLVFTTRSGATEKTVLTLASGSATFANTIKTSKGNLTRNFDINGSGTVDSADSLAYAKIGVVGKLTTDAPVLTPHIWMEGDWATTTSSHSVIACVEGNALNALKIAVGQPPLQTGDTMFIGNVDANQRAASGFFVGGDKVGMFGYDNNSEQNATTSTLSIVSSNDGTGRWIISASGGVRVANTLTVAGGIVASTGFIQTRSYADTAARDTAIPTPVAGMMVLAGTTFFGYNGSAWVAFN